MKGTNEKPELPKQKPVITINQAPSLKIDLSKPQIKGKENEFNEMVVLPHIINDYVYISRKKTIDTFVRRENLQTLKKEIKMGIDEENLRRISENEQMVLSKKRMTDFEKDVKRRKNFRGCMYTHELWSDGYYNMILSSSLIKSKYDEISNALKCRKLTDKIKKTHELFNKTHKDFKFKQGSDGTAQEKAAMNGDRIRSTTRSDTMKKLTLTPRHGYRRASMEIKPISLRELKPNEILRNFYEKQSQTLRKSGHEQTNLNYLNALSSPNSKKSIILPPGELLTSRSNTDGKFSSRVSLLGRSLSSVPQIENGSTKWAKKGCHMIVNKCSKIINDNKVIRDTIEKEFNSEQNHENQLINNKILAEIEKRLTANKEAEKAAASSILLKGRGTKPKAFYLYDSDSDDSAI